jgi:hypothetical protein
MVCVSWCRDKAAEAAPPLLLLNLSPRTLSATVTLFVLFMSYPAVTSTALRRLTCIGVCMCAAAAAAVLLGAWAHASLAIDVPPIPPTPIPLLCACGPAPEVDGVNLVKFDLATKCSDGADRGISGVVIAFVSVGFPILTSSFLFYINERSR